MIESSSVIEAIMELNEEVKVSPFFLVQLNTLALGISQAVNDPNVNILPQSVKQVAEETISTMLSELSAEIKAYYTKNDFTVNPQVIEVMREVVKINERG